MSGVRSPVEVVQAQLDAYNRRDLDAFCATFAEDAQLFELGGAAPATVGRAAIAKRYGELFEKSPALHSVVVNPTVFGRAVIDLERITGRNGASEPFDILVIYEVEHGAIVRSHFVRP